MKSRTSKWTSFRTLHASPFLLFSIFNEVMGFIIMVASSLLFNASIIIAHGHYHEQTQFHSIIQSSDAYLKQNKFLNIAKARFYYALC